MKMDAIYLTLDMDDAPEYMMEEVLGLLREHDVPATIFATGESRVLRESGPNIEVGLHPKIRDMYRLDEYVTPLKELYPEARCLRSHGLISSSNLLLHAWKSGITVTSNYISLDRPSSAPIPMLYSIHEYPITFMDDVCLLEGGPFNKEALSLSLDSGRGFGVLIFHFVHIYLNAVNFEQYRAVKGKLHDKELVDSHVQSATPGVRDLFLSMINDKTLRRRCALFPEKAATTTHLNGGLPT